MGCIWKKNLFLFLVPRLVFSILSHPFSSTLSQDHFHPSCFWKKHICIKNAKIMRIWWQMTLFLLKKWRFFNICINKICVTNWNSALVHLVQFTTTWYVLTLWLSVYFEGHELGFFSTVGWPELVFCETVGKQYS